MFHIGYKMEMQNVYDHCSHVGYIKTQSHIPNMALKEKCFND